MLAAAGHSIRRCTPCFASKLLILIRRINAAAGLFDDSVHLSIMQRKGVKSGPNVSDLTVFLQQTRCYSVPISSKQRLVNLLIEYDGQWDGVDTDNFDDRDGFALTTMCVNSGQPAGNVPASLIASSGSVRIQRMDKRMNSQHKSTCARGLVLSVRKGLSAIIAVIALLVGLMPVTGQQGGREPAPNLQIVILAGDDAMNNIRQRTAREAIVRVEDENHRPVAGVAITASLPNHGAGGEFVGGGKIFTGTTKDNGQLIFRFRPNKVEGRFQIRLHASFNGKGVAAVISQTNVGVIAGPVAVGVLAKVLIGVAVGAGVGVSAGVVLKRGGGEGQIPASCCRRSPSPRGRSRRGRAASLGPPSS